MDKLKGIINDVKGSSNQGAAPQAGGAPAGQEDYADKGSLLYSFLRSYCFGRSRNLPELYFGL